MSVRSDEELMMKACSKDYEALMHLDVGSLALDKDILQHGIDTDIIWHLNILSHEAQRMFPELLKDNLRRFISAE